MDACMWKNKLFEGFDFNSVIDDEEDVNNQVATDIVTSFEKDAIKKMYDQGKKLLNHVLTYTLGYTYLPKWIQTSTGDDKYIFMVSWPALDTFISDNEWIPVDYVEEITKYKDFLDGIPAYRLSAASIIATNPQKYDTLKGKDDALLSPDKGLLLIKLNYNCAALLYTGEVHYKQEKTQAIADDKFHKNFISNLLKKNTGLSLEQQLSRGFQLLAD